MFVCSYNRLMNLQEGIRDETAKKEKVYKFINILQRLIIIDKIIINNNFKER